MARFRLATIALLAGVLICSELSAAQASKPVAINATTEAKLAIDIPDLMKKAGIPGLSIAVMRSGKTVWAQSFGVRDEKTGKPVTADTMFNVGSLSKPVFAYGVLKLVDAGKLKLDEPLQT